MPAILVFALLAAVQGAAQFPNFLVGGNGYGVFPWMNQKNCPADAEFYQKDIRDTLPRDFMQKIKVPVPYATIEKEQRNEHKKKGKSLLESAARYNEEIVQDLRLAKPYDTDINKQIFTQDAHEADMQAVMEADALAAVQSAVHAPKGALLIETVEPTIESWYVNMDKSTDRKDCMERQLHQLEQKPNRFPAVSFPEECVSGDAPEQCLKEKGFGDCFEGGIDYKSIGTHGSRGTSDKKLAFHVVANWCSHKRLFEQLEEKKKKDSDFFLVLEDDVILDRQYTVKVLKDFAKNYKDQSWDLLQIDPFGGKSHDDLKGHFKGKPVWAPTTGQDSCKQYWGFQAVLIRSSGLSNITSWMKNNKAMPVDWLPTKMPNVQSFGALIARNPEEAANFGRFIAIPDFCSKSIIQSTIAAQEGKTEDEKNKKSKKGTSFIQTESTASLLLAATARLTKVKQADAKMAEYLHALWAQAEQMKGDEAFEKELKEVEGFVRDSGATVRTAQDVVSEHSPAVEEVDESVAEMENAALLQVSELQMDAPDGEDSLIAEAGLAEESDEIEE